MNKKPRFIPLLSDTTAKALIKDEHYRWFYEDIIKYLTGIDLKGYKLIDNELNSGNKVKDYRTDLIFEKGKHLVNLELNQFVYRYTLVKNRSYALRLGGYGYLSGEDYKERYVTQINLNNKIVNNGKKEKSILNYKLQDSKYKRVLKNIKIMEIYLLNYKNIVYNGTNKYDTYVSMLTATSFKELEEIVGDLEEGRRIMEKLKELGLDDKYGAYYDAEIVRKKEINSARSEGYTDGKKEGKKETLTSIAKNLLNMNLSIKDIMKATGLKKKDIMSLM